MNEESNTSEIPEEEQTRYAILITVFGGLLALLLVAILGATLFTLWGANAAKANEPAAVSMNADAAEALPAEEAEADQPAAEEAPPVEEPATDEATSDEIASADGPSAQVVTALTKATCIACHVIPDVPGAMGMVGPDLSNIGVDGATRVEGQSAVDYIHESIVDPEAFIAPECPTGKCSNGLMSPAFGQMLSGEELDAVVAYLGTLGQ